MSEMASSPFCRPRKVLVNGAGNVRCLTWVYRHFVLTGEITLRAIAIGDVGIRAAWPPEHAMRWRMPSPTTSLAVDERVAIVAQS
jgi:hypothetical protein